MKRNLLLKERLQRLRKDRGLTVIDIEKRTGIPKSTFQRLEADSPDLDEHETRVGYQDIVALAKFFDVSTDYLCGLTENLRYSNNAIDRLHLSDEAVAEIMSGKFNNRLLSEIITHPDFAELLAALEVFIDRTISENMNIINMSYKAAVDMINKQAVTVERDKYIATLNEAQIDPDDYIRFRLTRRFEGLVQNLYETHAKEAQAATGESYIKMFNDQLSKYESTKEETGSTEEAKLAVLADQLGVNIAKAPEEEKKALHNLFKRSKFKRFIRKRK